MKKGYVAAALAGTAVFLMATGGNTNAYTINDDDLNDYVQRADNHNWVDFIGEEEKFDTKGIDVSWSGPNVTFNLYTNFPGGVGEFKVADFGIDLDNDYEYEYGVVLKNQNINNLDRGLYSVTGLGWDHSIDLFGGRTDINYGLAYDENDPNEIPVAINSNSARLSAISYEWFDLTAYNYDYNYLYTFSFDIGAFGGDFNGKMNVLWGTATCGNDVISGSAPVPEPGTMILLGTGLAGLVGLNRKKYKNKNS